MDARIAFVLNLDADRELAAGRARGYTPTRRVLEAMRPHVATLARTLVGAGDLLVDDTTPPGTAAGCTGRAFCPTPRALALLRRSGAKPEPHPSFEVLRRVNSRAFASGLGATMEGARFVSDLADARAVLARAPPLARAWRVKRAFGMAGRGQRVLIPGPLAAAEVAFLRAGIDREGGVQIEPNVSIVSEHAIHGRVSEGGSTTVFAVVRQRCDARGAWLSTEPVDAGQLPGRLAEALPDEARRVGAALHAAGYFGPFGVDAYTYEDGRGSTLLQPRSEINARYSMGWAVGARASQPRSRSR